jgi:hypothetical protein
MRTGDTATLKKELAFVPTSMAQDAVSTVRIQTNAARARLSALTSRRNR